MGSHRAYHHYGPTRRLQAQQFILYIYIVSVSGTINNSTVVDAITIIKVLNYYACYF